MTVPERSLPRGDRLSTRLYKDARRNWTVYLMLVPVLAFFIIFCYFPMGGLVMAFENYKIKLGLLGSKWVGLAHFERFFNSAYCTRLVSNTLLIGLKDILWSFPLTIIFALLLNEVRSRALKKYVQMVSYLPYFISLVVVWGLVRDFTRSGSAISDLMSIFTGKQESLLANPSYFQEIFVFSGIWQGMGYGAIVYLSALTAINQDLYEAAEIDGAGHFRILFQIILPVCKAVVAVVMLFYVVQHWNSWFRASLYLKTRSKYPLQLWLREIIISASTSSMEAEGGDVNAFNLTRVLVKYCVIMLSIAPMMVIYPFVQRYFVTGVMIGSVKE